MLIDKGNKTVTIPISEYLELLESQHDLEALTNGGVDNWESYGWSFEDHGPFIPPEELKGCADDNEV